ncbi:MAG: crotonase/enoyl-CoA hydratase family protein [Deltaproteobacteria bacterium]|nr:crotonase/enoyl-CoA hydratase family protein [Deltaproteobacteria bacterium]
MSDRVSISIDAGVADVRLNRPEKMNALDRPMFDDIAAAGARLAATSGLRAVVLSGNGRAFCAGLDMASFTGSEGPGDITARTHGAANLFQEVAWLWRQLPVPVVAAVHGVAFGGGFQIMLGADVRIAAPDTKLSIMEIKWGLVPDMAGIALTRGLMRDDVLRELTFTGRIFNGAEGVGYGCVTHVDADPHAAATRLAREIAAKNPEAIRSAKRLYNDALDADGAALLAAESREQKALIGTANQLEAVMANIEKRAPIFRDPA